MKNVVDQYQKGEVTNPNQIGAYGCRSLEEIDRYFSVLIHSYNHIKDNGYKTQEQLLKEKPGVVRNIKDEIRFYISRDGELILGKGGTNRLLIAQLLELSEVSGIVRGVH